MIAQLHPRLRSQGFTLIEIIISLVLLGILGITGSKMITGSFSTTQIIGNGHLSNSMARYAMERMARDIREIRYDVTNIGNELRITGMTPSTLSFQKSGLGNSTANISYSYVKPNLTLNSTTLANNISNLSFTYLDANGGVLGASIGNAQSVRSVLITLTATPTQAQSISLTTQVKLRNP